MGVVHGMVHGCMDGGGGGDVVGGIFSLKFIDFYCNVIKITVKISWLRLLRPSI